MSLNPTHFRIPMVTGMLISGVLCLPNAQATEQQDSSSHWGLGVAATTITSPYTDVGNKTGGLPFVGYESQYLRFFGNTLDVKLPSSQQFQFSLRAKLALGEGYKASDSSIFTGMQDRVGGVYLGAATKWITPWAEISLEYLADSSGKSNGSELKLGFERSFNFDHRFNLTPHFSIVQEDKNYVDYYYGVTKSEATTVRPLYLGDATTNTEIGLRLGYAIDVHNRVLIDITDTQWGSGIKNSPLVSRASATGFKAAYFYRF